MESIEKLRELASTEMAWMELAPSDLERIADEIEREIAECYLELPVDADGVPIHVGDEMEAHGEVLFVAHDKVVFEENNASPVYRYAKGQRHIKPDPVKELLEELLNDIDYAYDGKVTIAQLIDEYAARIREAVER